MTSPATIADISARWRPLTDAESLVAETRLQDAWRKLKRDVPTLEQRMINDSDLADDVVRVLADAVIRLLRNPEGLRRGTVAVDDASRTFEYGSSIGEGNALFFTDAELGDLSPSGSGGRARAFSVLPS